MRSPLEMQIATEDLIKWQEQQAMCAGMLQLDREAGAAPDTLIFWQEQARYAYICQLCARDRLTP